MKKIISLAIAFCCAMACFSACGSKTGNVDEGGTIADTGNHLRLGAFYTPYNGNAGSPPYGAQGSDNTEENWKVMAEAGFNLALPIYDTTHEHVITSLKNAEKAGITTLVMDYENPSLYNIIRHGANATYEETMNNIRDNETAIKARIDEFAKYKSFGGLHAFDEPSVDYYNAIAACQDWWYENYPQYEFYVNLYPSYASDTQLYGSQDPADYTFRKYVNDFVQTVNPSCLSYDHYTLQRSGMMGTIRPQWLSDLEVFADASKEYDIPFYLYFLTTRHWSYIAPEYYREIAWQVYSAMCFGVQGLQAFTYWSYLIPDNNTSNLGTGVVGPRGEKTACYYAVQEVFSEIKSFDTLYTSFKWDGTKTIGKSGNGTFALMRTPLENLVLIDSVTATADALVGQFKDDNGNYAYMVMNYSSPFSNESNKITLHFNNADRVLVCKKGKRIIETLNKGTLELDMGSGEGYFVVPIK